MNKFTILLDMDEVLVDFIGGALRVHGVRPSYYRANQTIGTWDMTVSMGLTHDEFWEPIHAMSAAFWTDLQPHPWAADLIKMLEPFEWYIVSSPSHSPTSGYGKQIWLNSYFGGYFDRFIPTGHKHLLAAPNRILIDDREKNCRDFVKHGGRYILFPNRGNRLHRWADDPLALVRRHWLFSGSDKCTSK